MDCELASNRHGPAALSVAPNAPRHVPALAAPPTRHPDLSFADGNIAILTGSVYFVVHNGLLARQSPPLQQASKNLDLRLQLEGRPILALPDSPQDMALFLAALYDCLLLDIKLDPPNFSTVCALLRLATKYQTKFRSYLLDQLQRVHWPTRLAQWDTRETEATIGSAYDARACYAHPILVINLARAIDAPALLPSAFYDLSRSACRWFVECAPRSALFTLVGVSVSVLNGMRSGAGCSKCLRGALPIQKAQQVQTALSADRAPQTTYTFEISCIDHQGISHQLSPDDLMNLLKGREHASRFLSTFIVNELEGREPSGNCLNMRLEDPAQRRACQAAFESVTFEILRDVNGVTERSSDPLFAMLDAELMQTRESQVSALRACEFCRLEFGAAVDQAREEFWLKMPAWFGVESELELTGWG
ncbi:hypothetical protein MKEN_00646200 [Mycena kentingensis (nom. inval.)]|nr:hypothetical protein MKEN_00646200 [Mycena kentingensis (nom. inval.)]